MFLGSQSQWRRTVGMSAAVLDGLDYTGVEVVMRHQGVPPERASEVFGQVQTLEDEMRRVVNAPE